MQFLRRSLTGILLMALTLAGIGWAGVVVYEAVVAALTQEAPARPARETVLTVTTATVSSGQEVPVLETYGEIRSRRMLELRASAAGSIVEISPGFEEGGRVSAGEVLLRVNPAEPRAELALARADLSEAEAELRDAERSVDLAHEDLAAAEEQAALREAALTRQKDLESRGFGSSAAVEETALSASAARQAVVSRRQALAQEEARVDLARTGLARSRIAVEEAERRLEDTEIRAGFDGMLSEVSAVEGGLVSLNEQLALVVDPDALEVAFRLSTAQYARLLDETGRLVPAELRVGMEVSGFTLETTGVIDRESAVVGTGQTGRTIFARLESAAGFRPGDVVTVRISEPPLDNVARLPALAVSGAGTVLVLNDEMRLSEMPVELLRREGDSVLVRAEGLDGKEVVAERTPLLGAGIRVRPLAPAGAGNPAADDEDAVVELTPERRARLIAFVQENSDLPEDELARVVAQLSQPEVPVSVVRGIEQRMGS